MKRLINALHKESGKFLYIITFISILASCDSILDYNEGDCSVEYRIRFKYDYNMKYANAFANEVKRVTLYAFDTDGKFVYQRTEEGETLGQDDYSMKVDIEPGNYRLVVWASLNDGSYEIPILTPGESDIEELTVKTNRIIQTHADNGESVNLVNSRLSPLWHGECLHTFTRAKRQEVITVPLVKNTNTFRIILQQMRGLQLIDNHFEFSIYDDNGWLNYDNSLLEDSELTYRPFYTTSGGITRAAATDGETTQISTAIAEISVGRLIAEKNPRLRITNKETGATVLAMPLIKFLLLTKPTEHALPAQEHLDRQDEYSMTFFLDQNLAWLQTEIIINGWIIRLNDQDI